MKNKAEIAKNEKPKANISKNFKQPKEKKTFKKFKPKEKTEKRLEIGVILAILKSLKNCNYLFKKKINKNCAFYSFLIIMFILNKTK